jgi:hypothetical protein
MIPSGSVRGPGPLDITAAWQAGNCLIVANSMGGVSSDVDLQTIRDTPADAIALRAWDKLQHLLESENSTGRATRTAMRDEGNGIWTVRDELLFNGTPAEFAHVAMSLTYKWGNTDEPIEFIPTKRVETDDKFIEVLFFGPGMRQQGIGGSILAEIAPHKTTSLTVRASGTDWPKVTPYWQLLRANMEEQGWIIGQGTAVNVTGEKSVYRAHIGQQLACFAWGKWRGSFETLDASLKTFARLGERFPFGPQSFQFVLLDNLVFLEPVSQGWAIGKSRYNEETIKTVEFEPGKFRPDVSNEGGWPYGEVTAREAAGFLKVELWHNGRFVDALFDYLFKLWTALLEDGLEPIQTPVNKEAISDLAQVATSIQNNELEPKLNAWEQIPDHKWDRLAVRLLWEEYQDPEIRDKIDKRLTSKTITNRLSVLRQQFPKLVPTREQLKRLRPNKAS